jgi:UDPglucose 6-dehydrogenase
VIFAPGAHPKLKSPPERAKVLSGKPGTIVIQAVVPVEGRVTEMQGWGDPPLSERGRAQAQGLAELLTGAGITRLVSSDLVRAVETAELIKYAANAFLAMKIGFANEIANICERVGADGTQVLTGIGLDSRIGPKFLNAGIGWGGSCFGKDVQSLLHTASEYGYHAQLLEATLAVNRAQRQLVIQKLQEKLFILKGRTIALLGLSFKPGTDDLRDAPSLQIAERLLQMGARVSAYDPISMEVCKQQHPTLKIAYCQSALDAVTGAHAVVLITEWEEFRNLDLTEVAARAIKPILIDGRNFFSPETAFRAGLDYSGIGRPPLRSAREVPGPLHPAEMEEYQHAGS